MLQLTVRDRVLPAGAPVAGEILFTQTRPIDGVIVQLVQRETTLENSLIRGLHHEDVLAERVACGAGQAHAGTTLPFTATLPPNVGPSWWTPHGRIEHLIRAVARSPEGESSVEVPIAIGGVNSFDDKP